MGTGVYDNKNPWEGILYTVMIGTTAQYEAQMSLLNTLTSAGVAFQLSEHI